MSKYFVMYTNKFLAEAHNVPVMREEKVLSYLLFGCHYFLQNVRWNYACIIMECWYEERNWFRVAG